MNYRSLSLVLFLLDGASALPSLNVAAKVAREPERLPEQYVMNLWSAKKPEKRSVPLPLMLDLNRVGFGPLNSGLDVAKYATIMALIQGAVFRFCDRFVLETCASC